jgi:hypothetical protein
MTTHNHITNPRRLALALGVAAACMLPSAGTADAAIYCVDRPECPGVAMDGNLQGALTAAAQSTNVPDEVWIGPHTYTTAGTFAYDGTSNAENRIAIKGVPGQTVIQGTQPEVSFNQTLFKMTGNGREHSSISGIKLRVPVANANATPGPTGLFLFNATAEDIEVEAAQQNGMRIAAGIQLFHETQLRRARVTFPPAVWSSRGIAVDGKKAFVEDVEVAGAHTGIAVGYDAASEVTRALVDQRLAPDDQPEQAVACYGCDDLLFSNSVMRVGGLAQGIVVTSNQATSPLVLASHVTIAGDGTHNTSAVRVTGQSPIGTKIKLENCVLDEVKTTLARAGEGAEGANIVTDHCNYDNGKRLETGVGNTQEISHTAFDDPGFVDGPGGDFRLLWSSPLLDSGVSTPYTAQGLTLDRRKRVVDGNLDGTVKPDLGAFEYQAGEPEAHIEGPDSAQAGQMVTLDGSKSSSGDPGEPVTFSWTLPDGSTATTPTVDLTLPAGEHKVALVAKDPTGKTASSYRTITVTPPPQQPALLSGVRVSPNPLKRGRAPRLKLKLADPSAVTATVQRRVRGRWRKVRVIKRSLKAGKRSMGLPKANASGSWRVLVTVKAPARKAKAKAGYRVR